jgi:hypothetical protein
VNLLRTTALVFSLALPTALPSAHAEAECLGLFGEGPLWAIIGFFRAPEAIVRAEDVRLHLSETRVHRGKMIVGRADGTAIEKFADRIETVTGFRVVLSDEANESSRTYGFVRANTKVSGKDGEKNIGILNLGKFEARRETPSFVAVHEATHAWLGYLDSIGEGNPLSYSFVDHGANYSGSYGIFVSAQELKTWSQDFVRWFRKLRESEIIRRFATQEKIARSELFGGLQDAMHRLDTVETVAIRVHKDLEDVRSRLSGLRDRESQPEKVLSLLFDPPVSGGSVVRLRTSISLELTKHRKANIPLNRKELWELALELKALEGDAEKFKATYRTLLAALAHDAKALDAFAAKIGAQSRSMKELVRELAAKKTLTVSEYIDARRKFAEYAASSADFTRSTRPLEGIGAPGDTQRPAPLRPVF